MSPIGVLVPRVGQWCLGTGVRGTAVPRNRCPGAGGGGGGQPCLQNWFCILKLTNIALRTSFDACNQLP